MRQIREWRRHDGEQVMVVITANPDGSAVLHRSIGNWQDTPVRRPSLAAATEYVTAMQAIDTEPQRTA